MEGSFTSELNGDTSWHILDEASESVSGESIHANVLETALPWNWGLCPSEVMIFEFALYFRICYFRLSDAMYHHGLQMCLRNFLFQISLSLINVLAEKAPLRRSLRLSSFPSAVDDDRLAVIGPLRRRFVRLPKHLRLHSLVFVPGDDPRA